MTSYSRDCASFDDLVPLYVKGLLPDVQREEFERSVAECPTLRDAIEEWKLIQHAYSEVECAFPEPSKSTFPRIIEKVREPVKESWFQRLMPSPSFSLAFMAVQFIVIITLGVYLLQSKHEYRTLNAPSVVVSAPIKINIVFKENTKENEIRRLLLQIDGKIIDGPYSSGLYVVGVTSGPDIEIEKTLQALKKNNIVAVAERAY
jgi:hypothetical protein